MASEVDICNRALQHLGAKRITSLTENSRNANSCNSCYETSLVAELEAHVWRFSIKRASLAEDAVAPTWGRAHAYTVPSDFIKFAPKYPEDADVYDDWELESGKILTDDTAPLYLRYVSKTVSVDAMPMLFREAVAARMALEMCEEVTQSNTKKANISVVYDRKIAEARKANAFFKVPQVSPDDTFDRVRNM